MEATTLRTRGLVKRYGDVKALGGVGLEVREGETFGLLGPNGARRSPTRSGPDSSAPRNRRRPMSSLLLKAHRDGTDFLHRWQGGTRVHQERRIRPVRLEWGLFFREAP